MAKGFSKVEGEDYEETFAPVEICSSIITTLTLATEMGWKFHEMDVKTTFLDGVVEEEVYIEKVEGFETYDWETCVLSK